MEFLLRGNYDVVEDLIGTDCQVALVLECGRAAVSKRLDLLFFSNLILKSRNILTDARSSLNIVGI